MNESPGMMSSEHLINLVVTRNGNVPNFALLLGSGASVTSGVKTAEEMVFDWRQLLHRQSNTRDSYSDWMRRQDWFANEDEYSLLFEEVYDQPAQRRVFVEECVKHAHAGLGYVYLTDLLANRFFDVVFTTNFDDLLNEACYLYSDSLRPIVAAHDSAIQSIRISSERPKIIKLHGDFLYDDIKNTLSEIETLEANTKRKLSQFAKEYGLIVLGYSGRDRSVMDNLELLLRDEENFPYGIYWCVRGDPVPSKRLNSLFTKNKVYPVQISGFDEFVAELHAMAGLDPPKAIEHPLEMARDRARIFLSTQLPLRTHKVIGPHIDRLIENLLVVDIELPLIAKAAIFTSQGELGRALQLWKQVYEEDPTDANTIYAYANALTEAGENDRLLNLIDGANMAAHNKTYFLLRVDQNEKVIEVSQQFLASPLASDRSMRHEAAIVMVNQAIAQRRLSQRPQMLVTLDLMEAFGYANDRIFGIAIAALRGEKDVMINALQERPNQVFTARELRVFPLFEEFREDPDFIDLVKSLEDEPPAPSTTRTASLAPPEGLPVLTQDETAPMAPLPQEE